MSVDATRATWKLDKQITAIQKLLLLALADRAGEDGECWPGIARLIKDTNLDRHTIVNNRQILIDKGFIEYTGELKGRTKSIPVMRLTYIDNREGEFTCNQEFFSNANSTDLNSVDFPTAINLSSGDSNTAKQCGFPHLEPKRIEPKINIKEKINKKEKTNSQYQETLYPMPDKNQMKVDLTNNPNEIPENLIQEWAQVRKAKRAPITPTVWSRLNKQLAMCQCSPIEAFEMMLARGWSTVEAQWINREKQPEREKRTALIDDTDWMNTVEEF